jgi:hypothetical protein
VEHWRGGLAEQQEYIDNKTQLQIGPFLISKKISHSDYKLTLPFSMQGVHISWYCGRKNQIPSLDGTNQQE